MKTDNLKVSSFRADAERLNISNKSLGSEGSGKFGNEFDTDDFADVELPRDVLAVRDLVINVFKFGALLYYSAILCYHFSFGGSISLAQTCFNYVVDFLFLVDYLIDLRESLKVRIVPEDVSNMTKNVEKKSPISKKSYFFWVFLTLELVAQILMVFPFEAFAAVGNTHTLRLLRLFRLLRIVYFVTYWEALFRSLNENGYYVSSIFQRTLFLALVVAAVGHVAACSYYSLSLVQMTQGYKHTWITVDHLAKVVETQDVGGRKHYDVVMLRTISQRYLRALYWSVQTLDTVGFGDIVAHTPAETWYCIFFFFVSALLIYLSIANLVMFATNLDSSRTENLRKISAFDKYASYRKLPKTLSKKVRAFYAYQWQQFKGIDELEILSELPPNISQQVIQCLVRDVLIQVDAFKGLSKGLLNSLSEFVDSFTYSPGDIIVMSDTVVTGLYVISNGEVEHLNIFGNVVETLQRPHCFGDRTLLTPIDVRAASPTTNDHAPYKSASEYRAKTFVEVFYIDGDVFQSICHPELLKLEESNIAARMHRALEGLSHAHPEAAAAVAGGLSPVGDIKSPEHSSNGTKKDPRHEVRTTEEPDAASGRMSIFNHFKFRFGSVTMGLNKHKAHLRTWRDFFFPQSSFRMLWDCGIFLIVVFYVLSVPLLFSGTLRQHYIRDYYSLIAVSYALDVVMLADLLCRLTVFSYLKNGILFSSLTDIRRNFREENNLLLVFLAYFPLDLILALTVDHRCLPLVRLLKILHISRLSHLLRNFEEVLIVFCDVSLSFEMSRFLGLYFLLFLLCHWIGCLWQLTSDFACSVLHDETCWRKEDMHSDTLSVDYKSMTHTVSYFRSLYFASNVMSSIGFSDSLPTNSIEVAVMIFVIFFGVLLFNTLLGAIAALMSNFNRDKKEFDSKVSKIKALMTLKNIPTDLETRILRYHEYIWARYGGVKETEVLNSLPRALRAEVTKHVMGPLIRKISFFCRSSEVVQQLVVDLLRPRIFLDDDAIVLCGELGKEMFIIEKGTAIVTAADKTIIYNTLSDGDYIGESSLLAVTRRTASAYAVGYVGTYYLTSDGFYNAFDKFPAEYSKILNYISVTQKIKQQMNIKSEGQIKTERQISLRQLLSEHENSVSHMEMMEINNRDSTRRRGSDELLYKAAEIKSKYTVHPESSWKLGWDVMIFCTLMYYSIVIPLRIALHISPWIYVIDYVCDIVNIVDDYFYSSVFAIFADGRLLTNVVSMRAQYRNSQRFLIDIATAFPYDLIVLYTVTEHFSMADRLWVLGLLRIPKMVKLLLVQNYFVQVERLFLYLGVKQAWLRLAELTCCVMFIAHWVACIWFLFSLYVHPIDGCAEAALAGDSLVGCRFAGTWVQQQIWTYKLPLDGGDQWSRFLRAINWSLPNLTSESLGDLNGINAMESLFTFFTLFVGLSINGVIIGSVTSLVSNANEDTSDMHTKIDVLRDLLTKRGVPAALIANATSFLLHATSHEGLLTLDQDKIFSKLPHTLLYSVNYHLKTLKYLRQCPFFDFCSDEVLRGISSKLRVRVYSKGDKIVTSGELGNEMFFLESGKVNVLSVDNKTVLSSLEDGAFFGETGLFFKIPRVATIVVSSAFCVCMVLTKVDLTVELRLCDYNNEEVLKSFKELQNSNQNRNICVLENLKAAKNPDSKLHKLIVLDEEDAEKGVKAKSLIQKLRIWMRPDGWPRIVWDCLGFLFLVYYCTSIPLYIAFFLPNTVGWYLRTFIWIDFLIDGYFFVDIFFKYFLFSFKLDAVHNKLCTSGDAIRQKYITEGYFYYDVVSSIPFEFLVFLPGKHPLVLFMCRVSHLLRAPQLVKYATLFESHIATVGYAISQPVSLLLKAGFAYVLLTHWLACVYFAIHRYGERDMNLTYVIADGLSDFNTVTGEHDICSVAVSFCYARSIYFVLGTLTSIGYGDISPYTNGEIIWQQVVAIMGAFIAATFVGFSEMYWRSVDAAGDSKIKTKLKEVEYYAGLRKLDPVLKDVMLAQYDHSWRQLKSVNGEAVHLFDQLSDACQMEIFLHLHAGIVSKVPILNDLPYQAKRRFAAALKPQIALRSSYLYRAGDIGLSFFFVSSGQVNVTLSTESSTMDAFGMHALKLQLNKQTRQGVEYDEGCHFGECCLLSNAGIRNDNALVSEDGEVYSMAKNDFWNACQYMKFADRRRFLLHLFGTVGIVRHVKIAASAVSFATLSEDEGGDDTHHIKYLYTLAYGVVAELSKLIVEDNMKQDSSDEDNDEDDEDEEEEEEETGDEGGAGGGGVSDKEDESGGGGKLVQSATGEDERSATASPVPPPTSATNTAAAGGGTNAKTGRGTVRHHNGQVTKVKQGTFRTERCSSKVGPDYHSLTTQEVKPIPIRTRLSTLFLGNRNRQNTVRPMGLTAGISRRDNIKIGKASVLQVKQLLHNKNLINDLKIKTETHLAQEQRLLSKRRNLSMLSSFADHNVSSGLLVDNDSGKYKEASARLTHLIAARRLAGGLEVEKDGSSLDRFNLPLTIVEENENDEQGDGEEGRLAPISTAGGAPLKKSESGTEECSPFVDDRKEFRWSSSGAAAERIEEQHKRGTNDEHEEDVLLSVEEADEKTTAKKSDSNASSISRAGGGGGYSAVPESPLVKREVFKAVKSGEREEDKQHSFPTPLRINLQQQQQQGGVAK